MFESQSKLLFDVPLSIVHSRKLDTALRDTVVSSHRSRKSWGRPTFDDKLFDASYKYLFRMKNIDDDMANFHIWPEMLTDALKGLKASDAAAYRRAVEITAASVKVQVELNNNSNTSKTTKVPVEMLQDYARKIQKFPSELMNLISLSKILEECIERLGLIDHPSYRTEQTRLKNLPKYCNYKNEIIKFYACWSKNLACISYKNITTVVPRDYLLLLHNKCSDLVSVLAFAFLSDGAGLDVGCYKQTVEFLESLAEIPKKYKNDGYSILKTLESIGIGQTLIEVDGQDNSVFLQEILTGIKSKYGFDFENHKVFRIMKSASIPFRHELMCLMKTLGHPFVDMKLGTTQLHDIVTDPLDIDAIKVANCVRHAKRSYIKTHIMKEHRWPPCKIDGSTRLQIPFNDDRDPDASIYMRRLGACKLDEYDFVEILPNLKFDECENLIPMIKDKTISVLRSSVVEQYLTGVKLGTIDPASREMAGEDDDNWLEHLSDDSETYDIDESKRKVRKKQRKKNANRSSRIDNFIEEDSSDNDIEEFLKEGFHDSENSDKNAGKKKKTQRDVWKETRLLLYFMVNEKEVVDHLKYIQEFCDNENIDFSQFLDYLIIRIVPKEKEMKVDFRGYGCKTFMDRARSVIAEHNIANYLGKYCHEQAITLSELEVMNRLVSFRRLAKAYRNYTPLYIVIDSSKWNNRFRTETVNPITRNLIDPIFDNHYFSHVMPTFEHTMIYVPDQSEVWYWWGQFGGIEGHHQYLWDVVYLAQIKTALEGCGFPDPVLFVKGDDLRAIVMIPPQELASRSIEDIRKTIVTAIKTGMEDLGHKINVGESYGSSKYFAFGKMASVGTIEMPQTFRKIEKCYGANNAFLPFLDDYVGSSFSNAHSSAKVTCSTIHCFVVSMFWMYIHLCTHPLYRRLTNNELTSLSFVPSLLGGFPIIYLHNMWVRAETDLLAPFIGLLKFLEHRYKDLFDCCRKFLRVDPIDPCKAFIGLLIDPYSLPIKKPMACSTVLRMKIQKIMKSIVVNEDIRQLMDAAESPEMKAVIDTLFSANVYSVKILSAIYEASPAGLLNELIRKFESGRSVIQVIITALGRARANRFVKAVLYSERRLHKFRLDTINGKIRGPEDLLSIYNKSDCPGKIAEDIRTHLWKKPVEGLSMPPIQHQIVIADPDDVFQDKFSHDHHFEYTLFPSEFNLGVELPLYKSCDRRPFTGHSTVMGVTAAKEQLIDRNEVTDKAKRLIDLLSWVRMHPLMKDGSEPNLEDVIYILLTFYVDLDPNELTPFKADRKHGTIAHHVRISAARESIVTNSLLNIYTRFEGNSNSHLKFRWESGHFMVNFLHIFCHSLFLMSMRLQFSNEDFTSNVRNWAITINCEFCLRTIEESPVQVDLSRIRGKTFKKFHSTSISKLAKEIIKESLSVVDVKLERLIQPAASLSLANSTSAIIQDFLIMGHINKEKMNDFNYKHTMSTEAKEILSDIYGVHKNYKLSQSEVKSMPMHIVFENLIISVVEYVYKEHRQHSDSTVAAFLSERPPSEFPWTELVGTIHESGFLTQLVRIAATKSGSLAPSVYSSVVGASVFIAQCAYRVYAQADSKFKIYPAVFLSHFKIKDVEKYIRPRAMIIKHKLAKSSLYPLKRSYSSTDEEKIELMDMAIVYWNLPLYNPDELNQAIADKGLNTIIPINLLDYDRVDEMYIEDLQDLPGCCRSYFTSDFFPVEYSERADILNESDQLKIAAIINLKQIDMVAKMEFIYATIEDCINRIRSHKKKFPSLKSNAMSSVDQLNQLSYENRDRGVRDVFYIKDYTDSTSNPIIENYIVPDTVHPYPRYLKTWYSNRFLGFGTSAPSKLAEIFAFLGFSRLPTNSAYVCLADGFGGFTAYIDTLTKRSKIMFNTLIVDKTMEAHPSDWDAERSHNEVDYEALKFHYHDLTLLTTIVKLQEYFPYSPLIVTCDAQTVGMDMRLRENLICNVATYFLSTRLPTSCLIIKLYMNEFDLNMRFIHYMRSKVFNIHLIKPKASGDNDEIYAIFDSGPNMNYRDINPVMLDGSPWPSLHVCNFLYKTFVDYKLGVQYKRSKTIIVKYNLELYHELMTTPPLSVRILMNKLGLPITLTDFDHFAKDNYGAALKYIYRSIESILREALREYDVLGDPDQGSKQAYDHLTLTSKQNRMGRVFTIYGLGICLKLFEKGVHITESLMREWFLKIYKTNQHRFDISISNPGIFFRGPLGASEFDLYGLFLDGAEMGLSLIGSLVYKYRSYPKDLKVTAKHSAHVRYDGVFAPVNDQSLFDDSDHHLDPFGANMMRNIYFEDSRLDDYDDFDDLDRLSDLPEDPEDVDLDYSSDEFEGDPEIKQLFRILAPRGFPSAD